MSTSLFPRRPRTAARGALYALAGVASLAAALPVAAQQAAERRTLAGDRVAVYNLVGSLRVEGGSGANVEVEVTRRGADAARLRVESGTVRGREALRVVYPFDVIRWPDMGRRSNTQLQVDDDGVFYGGRGSGRRVRITGDDGADASADVVVRVPKGRDIAVYLAAGEATVRNVDGRILVDVGSANVTTSGTRGHLTLDTGSGTTRVSDAEGTVLLDTGSGSVTVDNVRGDEFTVDAGSGGMSGSNVRARAVKLDLGSGDTRLTGVATDDLYVDSGSGSVDVALTTSARSVFLDSGSGDVTLRLPANFGASLEVDTGSGGIDTDIPITVTRRSRSSLVGTIGDGKGRVRIDSGSGEVRLVRGS